MNNFESQEEETRYYKFWCHIWKVLAFIMMFAIIAILTSVKSNAQDTTRTPIGYDIDYAHVYVRVDTIHSLSYIYNYYPHKMYFSVNKSKAVLVQRKAVITVWAVHFTLTASRKKYKRIYKY